MTWTCDHCGATESDAARLLAWSAAVEGGRARRFCSTCTRAHLRAAEAKLDSEHW